MAFGSEERRRVVVDTIRRDGQLTRGGNRSAFAVALASVEFDLAGVLKDDHAALALEALRCDVNVYDLLDWAVDQAPVPDAQFTEFVVALLEALPLTTLPALPERPYYEHHAFNARIAMKARHLCPSPLPEYAVETWDTVARWALHPSLIEAEREPLYQKHLSRDWPRTDPERPESLALSAARQVVLGFSVEEPVVGALLSVGQTDAAVAVMSAMEVHEHPAGSDPIPTAHDLARFDDIEVIYLLSRRLARVCFERSIAVVGSAPVAPHDWRPVAAEDQGMNDLAEIHRRSGRRALELAHWTLQNCPLAGHARAHSDAIEARRPPGDPADVLRLLSHAFSHAPDFELKSQAASPLWKIEALLYEAVPDDDLLSHDDAEPDFPTPGEIREFCELPL